MDDCVETSAVIPLARLSVPKIFDEVKGDADYFFTAKISVMNLDIEKYRRWREHTAAPEPRRDPAGIDQ